jgi:hypothetical protein
VRQPRHCRKMIDGMLADPTIQRTNPEPGFAGPPIKLCEVHAKVRRRTRSNPERPAGQRFESTWEDPRSHNPADEFEGARFDWSGARSALTALRFENGEPFTPMLAWVGMLALTLS